MKTCDYSYSSIVTKAGHRVTFLKHCGLLYVIPADLSIALGWGSFSLPFIMKHRVPRTPIQARSVRQDATGGLYVSQHLFAAYEWSVAFDVLTDKRHPKVQQDLMKEVEKHVADVDGGLRHIESERIEIMRASNARSYVDPEAYTELGFGFAPVPVSVAVMTVKPNLIPVGGSGLAPAVWPSASGLGAMEERLHRLETIVAKFSSATVA